MSQRRCYESGPLNPMEDNVCAGSSLESSPTGQMPRPISSIAFYDGSTVPPARRSPVEVAIDPVEFPDGDSGEPVWNRKTGAAIGLISGSCGGYGYIAPLVWPEGFDSEKAPGILAAPGMGSLRLVTLGG
jgi:hypothetical protein